jgi:hypothetical protein
VTNFAVIYMHPSRFEIVPPCPEVYVGLQDFVIGIDWTDNQNTWDWVRVQNFTRPNGAAVTVSHSCQTLQRTGATVNKVTFANLPASGDAYYKYELLYHRSNGEEFLLDPTLMVRKLL